MSAWNFKARFADGILDGTKTSTIRASRKDGRNPKIGDQVKAFTGMRTKQCRQLATVTVIAADWISIYPPIAFKVMGISGVSLFQMPIEEPELLDIAKADGFESLADFWAFFNHPLKGFLYRFALVPKVD